MAQITVAHVPNDVVWVVEPNTFRVLRATVLSVNATIYTVADLAAVAAGQTGSPYSTPVPSTTNIPQTTPNFTGTTSGPTTTLTPIVTTTGAPTTTTTVTPTSSAPVTTAPPSTLAPEPVVDYQTQTIIRYYVLATMSQATSVTLTLASTSVFPTQAAAISYASTVLQPA